MSGRKYSIKGENLLNNDAAKYKYRINTIE